MTHVWATFRRIAATLDDWEFDRIWGAWWRLAIRAGAKDVVRASVERYLRALER